MLRIPTPPPGVYPDIPFATYLAWDAVSNSQLSKLARSPAHLKASWEEPDEDTTALRVGRAVHCAVLEPDRFIHDYTPFDGDRRTKDGKAAYAAIIEAGQVALPASEYTIATSIRDAIRAHPSAGPLFAGEGRHELSLIWDDPTTGVRCKARQDRHSPFLAGGAIVDLKSTQDAEPGAFARSMFTFGYHRQGAHYVDGAAACGLPAEHFVIVAAEKEAPFGISVFRLNEGAITAGREEVGALLARYQRCVESGEWPGYPAEVRDLTLPDWAWKASQNAVERISEEVFA